MGTGWPGRYYVGTRVKLARRESQEYIQDPTRGNLGISSEQVGTILLQPQSAALDEE